VHPSQTRRYDIQALRALAVGLVFAYHLWPSRLPGGFIGVDVFFVISGFLITGMLVREAEATGSIRVVAFWLRRARRLLPAALIVLAVAAVATLALAPANLWPQFLREILASTFYVQNWLLVSDSVDYLAANNAASPVQHFWTLSAEEQFYAVTPLVLLASVLLARLLGPGPGRRRRALLVGVALVTVISFAVSVWLTAVSPPQAYFATVTRAWEFGLGALLVFLPAPASSLHANAAVAAGIAGIVTSAFLLSGGTPFPGWIAAWPVVSAAAAIWGGSALGRRGLRLARLPPIQLTGDVSYSIYLWHWPLIIFGAYLLDRPLGVVEKVVVVAATFVLATISTRYIEDPIRHGRVRFFGGTSSPRILVPSAIGMALVVLIAGSGLLASESRRAASAQRVAQVTATEPDCLGAMAIWNAAACSATPPSANVVPDPAEAPNDSWNLPECWATVESSELHVCSFGPADATVRLAAIGDSHSNSLLVAYRAVAEANHWRVDVAGHNGCYWTTAVQRKPVQAMVDACEAWKRNLEAWLDGQPPYAAILVTFARLGAETIAPDPRHEDQVTVDGLLGAWGPQMSRGSTIVAIRDNPAMEADVVTCVVRHVATANTTCARPEREAVRSPDPLVEAVQRADRARLIDLTSIYCPGHLCLTIIGGVVIYADRAHVTSTWAASLGPILTNQIAGALAAITP